MIRVMLPELTERTEPMPTYDPSYSEACSEDEVMRVSGVVEYDNHGDPVEGTWYLDVENSLLCPDCAVSSDTSWEVPQFRPHATVSAGSLTADDYCAGCGREPDNAAHH